MFVGKHESIQSIIYRTHLLNSITDFANILDKNGRWNRHPKIMDGTLWAYSNFCDRQILSILKKQMIAKSRQDRLDEPAPYLLDLQYFYRERRDRRIPNKELIRYCMDCVHESIATNGFCSFKVNWLNGRVCERHKRPLNYIPPNSRKDSLKCLNLIFQGVQPKECVNKFAVECYEPENIKNGSTKLSLHFPPCIQEEFLYFIWKEMLLTGLDNENYQIFFGLGFTKFKEGDLDCYKDILKRAFFRFRHFKSNLLKKFSNEIYLSVEKVSTDCESTRGLTEAFVVCEKSNCDDCVYFSCLKNTSISHPNKKNISEKLELIRRAVIVGKIQDA